MRFFAFIALLFCLTAAACVRHGDIELGHQHVAAQDYRAALAAYQRALEHDPDSDEARRLIAQIAPYAAAQADREGREALARGSYAEALQHAHYLAELDPEAAAQLRGDVATVMRAGVEGLLAEGRYDDAYPLAAQARRLLGADAGIDGALGRLRAHYHERSESLTQAGQFEQALAALDVIAEHEPAMAATLEPRRRHIGTLWSDRVATAAADAAAAEQPGVAAVLYARAYEIAGREQHAQSMRQQAAPLAEQGRFLLRLRFRGDVQQADRLGRLIEARASSIEGVALEHGEGGVTMSALLELTQPHCSQRRHTNEGEQEYISGTRWVDNPAWHDQQRRVESAASDVDRRDGEAEREAAEVDRLDRALQRCEERRSRHEHASRPGKRHPERAPDCGSELRSAERARQELSEARAELGRAERELRRLEAELDAIPAKLEEDVIDVFRYPIQQLTRSCSAEVDLDLDRAWREPHRSHFSASDETRDDAHDAYPQYGVVADPLVFPQDDASLIAGANRHAVARTAELFVAAVADYYGEIAGQALDLLAGDEPNAVAMMVALVVAGGGHLGDRERTAMASELHQRYGLESLETLRR